MASSVLRSAGGVLWRSIPQRRSPISDFVGRTQPSKYFASSSGPQKYLNKIAARNNLNEVKCEILEGKTEVLTQVMGGLKKEFKELESVIKEKDAMARRYARQRPFMMLAGVTAGFGLGFYANQRLSG
ncbi:unnamed protein product [Alopecurus aequalis]